MRALEAFLEDGYVRRIIDACRESQVVQGVLVEIEPLWLAAWRLGERFDPEEPGKGFDQARRDFRFWRELMDALRRFPITIPWNPYRAIEASDLSQWRPEDLPPVNWDRYRRWPVNLRICLHPRGQTDGPSPPRFNPEGFGIQYEVRPTARLHVGPKDQHRPLLGGVSIGVDPKHAGTLGGILKDHASGKYYGVTCAHIVGQQIYVSQPALIDGHAGVIGKVIAVGPPNVFPKGMPKLVVNQQANASKVDVALVEIDPATAADLKVLKMGRVTDFVALDDIAQDEELELTGRSSDWQKVQKSSVAPYYNLSNQITGEEYCFEKPLVIRESTGSRPHCRAIPARGSARKWAWIIIGPRWSSVETNNWDLRCPPKT
jgi:hypothetical protein